MNRKMDTEKEFNGLTTSRKSLCSDGKKQSRVEIYTLVWLILGLEVRY
jgi:hypothetical protein